MLLLAELHDVQRFPTARALMAYLGLVPGEHSSGDRHRRGPIHHRRADRVRAHVLLCMLAYYVEWHMH